MTLPPQPPRFVNYPARRAGILLIVLAAVSLCLGGIMALFRIFLTEFEGTSEGKQSIDQLREQFHAEPSTIITFTAVMFLVYAVAGIVIGIGLLGGKRKWVIAGLVFTLGCTLLMVLNTLSSITLNMGGLLPLLLVAIHGIAAYWLMAALNPPQYAPPRVAIQPTAPPPNFPAPQQPMQGYYDSVQDKR